MEITYLPFFIVLILIGALVCPLLSKVKKENEGYVVQQILKCICLFILPLEHKYEPPS